MRSLRRSHEKIGDAEIVVTNKTPVSRETMDRCPGIRLIAVMATGYNIVDYTYAREKGDPGGQCARLRDPDRGVSTPSAFFWRSVPTSDTIPKP